MIHYHGTPITPTSVINSLAGRHFCVSFARPDQVKLCHQIGQSVMLDNGAYSVWRQGGQIDWYAWADWVSEWLDCPTTWCVLPDSIEGGEDENDSLLAYSWPIGKGVPVWHLHESWLRLARLVDRYHRVCFGSSGEFATVGSVAWHRRVSGAFDRLADEFGKVPWVHMLRGMSMTGSEYPFASVDSTDIARNHNRQVATRMADRWDTVQNPHRWVPVNQLQLELEGTA